MYVLMLIFGIELVWCGVEGMVYEMLFVMFVGIIVGVFVLIFFVVVGVLCINLK